MMKNKLTGKKLLMILMTLSQEDLKKQVRVEGCDCINDAKSVDIDHNNIDILRDNSGKYKPNE